MSVENIDVKYFYKKAIESEWPVDGTIEKILEYKIKRLSEERNERDLSHVLTLSEQRKKKKYHGNKSNHTNQRKPLRTNAKKTFTLHYVTGLNPPPRPPKNEPNTNTNKLIWIGVIVTTIVMILILVIIVAIILGLVLGIKQKNNR
jgi:hypothetical protein